jgi:hypothetical protein
MTTLFIDIQTIPCQNQALIGQLAKSVKPPANYSQADSIAKWYQDNLKKEVEKKYRQTALDGLLGEIFSIAWAVDDGEVQAFWRDEQSSESGLLENFMQELAGLEDGLGNRRFIRRWVGHFISGFDLRFIWQRCVINRVRPTVCIPLDARAWDDRVFDTKFVWSGGAAYSGQAGLDALAQGFGLQLAGAGNGNPVYEHWLAGRYDDIAEYNRRSLSQVRDLYRRMNFMA